MRVRAVWLSGAFAAVLSGALTAVVATAQPAIAAGTRVRIVTSRGLCGDTTVTDAPCIGRLVTVSAETLVVDSAEGHGRVGVPMSQVRRIFASDGRANHQWAGAAIGGALTAIGFIKFACAFSSGSGDCGINSSNAGGVAAYALVGAIPGVAIGALVGRHIPGDERWRVAWTAP